MIEQSWKLKIQGVVQSVGFRPFIKNLADELSLSGYVRNLGSFGVEIGIIASVQEKNNFITSMTSKLPELAVIHSITEEINGIQDFNGFSILQSIISEYGIAPIPPDIPICKACLDDLETDPRRLAYPFVSCTNCGPRYSTIEKLPYDRPNTAFSTFPLCNTCTSEYSSSDNRRFHAQTTVCRKCGPEFTGYEKSDGNWSVIQDHWRSFNDHIKNGNIVAMKGQSGTHLICDAKSEQAVSLLRSRRRKSNKPFAIMCRDVNTAKKIAVMTDHDIEILTSKRRPIVVVPEISKLNSLINPKLSTIGIMLPYAAMHHILFDHTNSDVLVFTSANSHNIPMPIHNETIKFVLKDLADLLLLHNLNIYQRVDDSVVMSHGTHHHIIRRSRGYTPQPHFLPNGVDPMLALGAEENNTITLASDNIAIQSQHLGHITTIEALNFQMETLHHLQRLYPINPKFLTVDLHPTFASRENARKIVDDQDVELVEIQHHIAHAASLALDNNLIDDALIWTIDGYGYGLDGQAWGGELIELSATPRRVASFEAMRYDGGDINALFPDRMLHLLTGDSTLLDKWNLKHNNIELSYLNKLQLKEKRYTTSSAGRFLDAMAALLDISHYRTYRGEPAILLGEYASQATMTIPPEISIGFKTINTSYLWKKAADLRHSYDAQIIAKWILQSLGISMAELVVEKSQELNIGYIGLSGGVTYNQQICEAFSDHIRGNDIHLIHHRNIAPGDAGISAGQVYYIMRYGNE